MRTISDQCEQAFGVMNVAVVEMREVCGANPKSDACMRSVERASVAWETVAQNWQPEPSSDWRRTVADATRRVMEGEV